jgi:hypothetical protein
VAASFDSGLFHEPDRIDFMDGYQNRRINVTMRYGRRSFHGGRAMRTAAATRFVCHG